jgi:hypothetical protein
VDATELKVEYEKTTKSTIATELRKEGIAKWQGKGQTKALYAGRFSRL